MINADVADALAPLAIRGYSACAQVYKLRRAGGAGASIWHAWSGLRPIVIGSPDRAPAEARRSAVATISPCSPGGVRGRPTHPGLSKVARMRAASNDFR